MNLPLEWLLQGEPWVVYQARTALLGQSQGDEEAQAARRATLDDSRIQALLAELASWPGQVLNSHKSAGHPLHKLVFLADLGLNLHDPGISPIAERIIEHRSDAGPFQVLTNIPKAFGGSGQDQWAWALCDTPLVTYALVRFGFGEHPAVQAAVARQLELVQENGWPCAVSPELGKFRGPGRKSDPCPFATLAMLRLLAHTELNDSRAARLGAESILSLWQHSLEQHPYLFHMGSDFRKLKAPLVWYDLLHVLDVLSRFPWLLGDTRLAEMVNLLKGKADSEGRFTAESIWTAWKEWEFGQKKSPSRWLTALSLAVVRRSEGNSLAF